MSNKYGRLAHNPFFHAKTQHMEIDLFFVRKKVLSRYLFDKHASA